MAKLPKSIIKKYGITKKAWSVFKGRKKTKSKKRASPKKTYRRKRKIAKKRSRRSGFGLSSIYKYIRIGSVVGPPAIRFSQLKAMGKPTGEALGHAMMGMAGIGTDGQFHADLLGRMWVPALATQLVTRGVGKLSGIIRRL